MKELSLHILDIAMNGIKAGASALQLTLSQKGGVLTVTITDNGCGMDEQTLARLSDPFFTTRTTRKVGMGVPLYRLAAQQTGGDVEIQSEVGKGTCLTAVFHTDHIDCAPLGDITQTVLTIIQGYPAVDLVFRHEIGGQAVELDTGLLKQQLDGVPIQSFEILQWIQEYITEQYASLSQKGNLL